MKIALISARRDPFISPHDVDGGCINLRNYIKELYNIGHEIHVFTRLEEEYNNASPGLIKKARAQKFAGIGKVRIKSRLFSYRIPYIPYNTRNIKNEDEKNIQEANSFAHNLNFYFNDESFDIYHYFHLFSVSGWLENNTYTSTSMPYPEKTLFSPLLPTYGRTFEYPIEKRLALEKQVCRLVSYIICVSAHEERIISEMYKIPKSKVATVPLGVDNNIFYPKRLIPKEFDKYLIISPNAIRKQKRQLEAVKITNLLKKSVVDVSTIFIGEIQDEMYFRDIIKTVESSGLTYSQHKTKPSKQQLLKTKDDVIFIDSMDQNKLANAIRECDISLFPSLDETFGLILLECMACGTPPICYNLHAYKDYLLPGENCVAINADEKWETLAESILNLIKNNYDLYTLSKFATNIAERFTWKNLASQQLNIYSKLLDKNETLYPEHFITSNWENLHQ